MISDYEVHIVEPTSIDAAGFKARHSGLEVRDCLLILEPNNTRHLGLMVRPPMGTTVVESVVRGEGGIIAIDASRVSSKYSPSELRTSTVPTRRGIVVDFKTGAVQDLGRHNSKGRFPTNLLLKHGPSCKCDGTKKVKPSNGSGTAFRKNQQSKGTGLTYAGGWSPKGVGGTSGYTGEDGKEEVANWICEPSCPAGILDRQSGRPSTLARLGHGGPNPAKQRTKGTVFDGYTTNTNTGHVYGDEGGASRFFKQVQTEDELESYLDTLVRGTK